MSIEPKRNRPNVLDRCEYFMKQIYWGIFEFEFIRFNQTIIQMTI